MVTAFVEWVLVRGVSLGFNWGAEGAPSKKQIFHMTYTWFELSIDMEFLDISILGGAKDLALLSE